MNRAGASLIAIWLTLCCTFMLEIAAPRRRGPPPPPGATWRDEPPEPRLGIEVAAFSCTWSHSTSIGFRRVPGGWASDVVEMRSRRDPLGSAAPNPIVLVTDQQLAGIRASLLGGSDCTPGFDAVGRSSAPLAIGDDVLKRAGFTEEAWGLHASESIDRIIDLSSAYPGAPLDRERVAEMLDAALVAEMLVEHVYGERNRRPRFDGIGVEIFLPGDPPLSARTRGHGPWMLPWEVRIGADRRLACSPELSERVGAIIAACRVPADDLQGQDEIPRAASRLRADGLHESSPWLGDALWNEVAMRLRVGVGVTRTLKWPTSEE